MDDINLDWGRVPAGGIGRSKRAQFLSMKQRLFNCLFLENLD